ncbi:MAG: hypothetical protein A2X64_00835 [Ignavibacteria bacterium GWF2_33_9]|nr:MAG: hypothetical protein A2X64_00835 [Ignavibacteria bacterium GWF2_33_9]
MIKTAIVLISNGTEDIEAVSVIDILRRGGVEVTVAGETDIVHFSNGIKILPDISFHKLNETKLYDLLFLPGGTLGVENILENEKAREVIEFHHKSHKFIAAICAAPTILHVLGLIPPGAKITSHPGVASSLTRYEYSEDPIVESGKILTSRGAGTAIHFGIFLLEKLIGIEIAEKVKNSIVLT